MKDAAEDDRSVRGPCASDKGPRQIADRLRRAAGRVHFPQLAGDRKPDETAVGRPEETIRALGAGKRPRGQRFERSNPNLGYAVGSATYEGQAVAVRRQAELIAHGLSLIHISPGTPLADLPKPKLPVTVTVANIEAQIAFIGIVPGIVGATQINYIIPANAPTGVQPVVVFVGGVPSPPAMITVK